MMNQNVKNSMLACLNQYATQSGQSDEVISAQLIEAFASEQPFLEKAALMDQVFDDFPHFDELREVFFDLLMINFFVSDSKNLEEDYLESEEWEEIEEKTLDRGTEMLNMFLYINECKEENIQPSINDFLKEFLLVDEDEFQDEYHIYEDFITHQDLVESSVSELLKVRDTLSEGSELREIFAPCMVFFMQSKGGEEVSKQLAENNPSRSFDSAIYSLLVTFNKV